MTKKTFTRAAAKISFWVRKWCSKPNDLRKISLIFMTNSNLTSERLVNAKITPPPSPGSSRGVWWVPPNLIFNISPTVIHLSRSLFQVPVKVCAVKSHAIPDIFKHELANTKSRQWNLNVPSVTHCPVRYRRFFCYQVMLSRYRNLILGVKEAILVRFCPRQTLSLTSITSKYLITEVHFEVVTDGTRTSLVQFTHLLMISHILQHEKNVY